MTENIQALVNGHLDGSLVPEQEAELGGWIKASPENARAFAEAVLLHDAMRNVMRIAYPIEPVKRCATVERQRRPWKTALIGAGLTGVAAVLFVFLWWTVSVPVSAASEMERLIQAPGASADRAYRIISLDPSAAPVEDRQAPIDGATLYVRAPDKYVLVRRFPDGRLYTTGSDGERNWSAPADGSVRVSRDPFRFRGPLPGHQHGIPFVNLRSDLVEIRDAYELSTLPPKANGWKGLLARRKSPEHRGPRRVELWYDAKSGVVHRMVFEGMPQARGGPKSLAVELIDQNQLAENFFQHESHHGPERRVIQED